MKTAFAKTVADLERMCAEQRLARAGGRIEKEENGIRMALVQKGQAQLYDPDDARDCADMAFQIKLHHRNGNQILPQRVRLYSVSILAQSGEMQTFQAAVLDE